MIVHNLNVKEIISINVEANAVLNIDTNAILSLTITMQQFQVIRWRNSQILQTSCIVDHLQFTQSNTLYCLRLLLRIYLVIYFFCFFVYKTPYHTSILYLFYVRMSSRCMIYFSWCCFLSACGHLLINKRFSYGFPISFRSHRKLKRKKICCYAAFILQ